MKNIKNLLSLIDKKDNIRWQYDEYVIARTSIPVNQGRR